MDYHPQQDAFLEPVWRDHIRLARADPGHAFGADRLPTPEEYKLRGLYRYRIIVYRNWIMHMTNEEKLGLPPAFPTPLSKTLVSNFGFYCRYDGRFIFQNFHSAYAAKHFLDIIISGVPLKWVADDKVLLENGMSIKSEAPNQLADALEHKHSNAEAQWRAPEPYPYTWAAFLGKRKLDMPDGDYTMPAHLHPTGQAPSKQKERKRPTDQERRARAVAKVRAGDHVTIAQIATDLKTEPRVLRSLLRRLAIEKPAHGWAWPPSEAQKIKSKLSGLLRGPAGA